MIEYTILSIKTLTAIFTHTCSDCGKTIPPGTKYQKTAVRSLEGFFVDKRCTVCLEKDDIHG